MDKLKKNSRSKDSNILSKSKFFNAKDMVPTSVPMINVALSGRLDGGLTPGLTVLAGPSKHFKTSFALLMAAAYLKQYPDSVMLFYDSEFGSPQSYFKAFNIDPERVFHTPVANVEELKFDLINQLEQLDRDDKVIVVIDSIGNIASKKELEDAKDAKSVADMSRAKAIKSLFRIATPYFTMKDIPCLAINHIYMEQGMYPKAIVSGGTGIYYSADNIWIVGRRQEKDGTEIKGYHFVINIEKSRFVKEKSKVPISVSWEGGIMKWSGLLDVAVEGGFVHEGKKGRAKGFFHMDPETGEVGEKAHYERETNNAEFWKSIIANPKFGDYVQKKYSIAHAPIMEEDVPEVEDEV